MSAAATDTRLHGLDAARGIALVLGVVLHASMSYFPGTQLWVVVDGDRSTALGVLFFAIHVMRMTAFFVLAGFFGRLLRERLGTGRFVRDRLVRIGVPMVAAWPFVFAVIVAVMVAAAPAGTDLGDGPGLSAKSFPLTHLWFLYVLLLLYAGTLLLRAPIAALDPTGTFRARIDAVVRGALGPWAPFLLALPVAWGLYRHSYWVMWFGIPTPDTGFVPSRAALVAYGTAFATGWLAHRQAATLLPRWTRWWPWHLALALAATAACLATVGLTPNIAPAPMGARKLLYALTYATATWSWGLALLGLGLRFLGAFSPRRRWLADASYWIYLAHLPLVMALQLAASRLAWPWFVEFPLMLVVAFALLGVSYQVLVRPTFIGRVLNGRRHPRRSEAPAPSSIPETTMRALVPSLILLSAAAPLAAQAPTLATVLAKHAEAIGPLAGITTRRTTLVISGAAPFDLPAVAEAKRPNLLRKEIDIQGTKQITGFDGTKAWRVDPFTPKGNAPQDVPAEELSGVLEESDFDGPLFDAAAKGHRLTYRGTAVTTVDGKARPVHLIHVTLKRGDETVIHLDATTFLEVKRVQTRPIAGKPVEMELISRDWRTVQGVKIPFLTEIVIPGLPAPVRLTIQKVEFGMPLDAARFARPKG